MLTKVYIFFNLLFGLHQTLVSDSSVGKESACNAGDPGLIPGLGRSPGERRGYPLQHFWAFLMVHLVKNPPAIQAPRFDPWVEGISISPVEGKGYPLQYSGLENPMDCIVHEVAKSRTQLNDFHFKPQSGFSTQLQFAGPCFPQSLGKH